MKLWVIKRGDKYLSRVGYYAGLENAVLFTDKNLAREYYDRDFPGEKVVRVKIKEVKK